MIQAKCFQCLKDLGIGKSKEELLSLSIPVFCSADCSSKFPENHTKEYSDKMQDYKNGVAATEDKMDCLICNGTGKGTGKVTIKTEEVNDETTEKNTEGRV